MLEPGLYLMDCMDGMRQFPDGFFDLAIVDPPYGGGAKPDDRVNGLLSGGGHAVGIPPQGPVRTEV